MGLILVGPYAAFEHIARGIYLSERREASKGFTSQKAVICKAQDGSYSKPSKYDKQKPGDSDVREGY